MSVLGKYLADAGQADLLGPGPGFDELTGADGHPRHAWSALLEGLAGFDDADLGAAQLEVARLLEDDNVTYTPSPAAGVSVVE